MIKEDYESFNNIVINDSVTAQDDIIVYRPPSPSLAQALTTYVPNISPNNIHRPRTEQYNFNLI